MILIPIKYFFSLNLMKIHRIKTRNEQILFLFKNQIIPK